MTPLGGIGIDLWLRGAMEAARALLLSKRNWGLIDVLWAAHAEARGPISSARNIQEPVVALCAEMSTARPTGRTSLGHLTFLRRGASLHWEKEPVHSGYCCFPKQHLAIQHL
jgi:hypothetical protein